MYSIFTIKEGSISSIVTNVFGERGDAISSNGLHQIYIGFRRLRPYRKELMVPVHAARPQTAESRLAVDSHGLSRILVPVDEKSRTSRGFVLIKWRPLSTRPILCHTLFDYHLRKLLLNALLTWRFTNVITRTERRNGNFHCHVLFYLNIKNVLEQAGEDLFYLM